MTGALPLAEAQRRLGRPGRPRKPQPSEVAGPAPVIPPRLLNVHAAARYLNVSAWTVRDLERAGVLHRVRILLPNGGELRKLLFDVVDLDELVAKSKV